MALSEANYSLALDYPLPQESAVPEQQGPESQSLLDIKDSKTLYQRNYSSRNKLDQADPNNFEVDMYTSDFQLGIFFRSFFICLFYTSGIGMVLSALCRCFHSIFYKNYFLYSNNSLLRIFGSATLIQLMFLAIISQKDFEDVFGQNSFVNNLGDILNALIVFSIASAAREAYCNQKLVEILKTKRLGEKSLSSTRFRVDYFWSRDLSLKIKDFETEKKSEGMARKEINKEKEKFVEELEESEMTRAIQTTICKLDINMSVYYLSFLEGTPKNLLRKLKQKQDLAVLEQGDFLIYNERFPEHDLLKAISHFEHEIFEYKYLTKPNQYDEKKVFGYSLALDILHNKKPKASAAAIMILILPATLFFFKYGRFAFNLFTRVELQDWSIFDRVFALVFTMPIARYFSWISYTNILFVLYQGVKIMSAKYLHMEELKELISTKTERLDDDGEKSYPTLNILDDKSLETWVRLRQIFMNLHDEKLQGITLAIALSFILQLSVIILNIFIMLVSDQSWNSTDFVQAGLHIIFYLALFLLFAFSGSKVNAQFKVHRDIILANKQTVKSLFKYYSDFLGEKGSEPGSYVENEGFKFLKEQYGENFSPEVEKEMKKEKKKLLETYDSVLAELEREESENPIKILGLPLTKTVVKSFGTLLVSLLLSVMKAQLSSLFKKE